MRSFDKSLTMTRDELKLSLSLGSIFSVRLFGMFMVLPVFSLYAAQLTNATPVLIGLAVGIYGLTQALLQIPFGMASDHLGRKPLIVFGLCLFILGSIIAAFADSITLLIIGRACQGAGAIGSTLIALLADLTRAHVRSKAMAIMGMLIGLSFFLALMLGPVLIHWLDVTGIFWCSAIMGVCALFLLQKTVPKSLPIAENDTSDTIPDKLIDILKNPELLRLTLGIFILHAALTACFIVFPFALQSEFGLGEQQLWQVFLPILALAFIVMLPCLTWAEKKQQIKPLFLSAISLLAAACLLLSLFYSSLIGICVGLFIFMVAFAFLESTIPSLVSRYAPAKSRGTAMGLYSSAQFLGIFVGGVLGGFLYGKFAIVGVFLCAFFLVMMWLIVAWRMQTKLA